MPNAQRRLLLFAKRPRAGKVKTRLVPPLTEQQALELYEVFLDDSARLITGFAASDCEVELCLDDRWDGALPPAAAALPRTHQGDGDLGQRLLNAFRRSAEAGAEATVIIGADAPHLPASRIDAAFDALRRHDGPVIVPADDGGYALIGLGRPVARLFEDIAWGGPKVTQETRQRTREAGLEILELEGWFDVDDAASLRRLREHVGTADSGVAPATRQHFRLLDALYSAVL